MLTVLTWRWAPKPGYRCAFSAESVNVLARMVRRHYPDPHRFVCVTDDAGGIDPSITIVPDFKDFADVPSPHGGKNPSCYRRLRMFHPEIAGVFGPRFVSLDLDVVITGDLRPLWNRSEDFVMCADTNPLPGSHYNGSMVLMTAGARPQVWTDFDPQTSPKRTLQARCWGSDQGWISYRLGPQEAKWTKHDGVYSFRNQLLKRQDLPPNAKVVVMHGAYKPWDAKVGKKWPWVREQWQ